MQKSYRNSRGSRFIWQANQTDPLTWTVFKYMNFRAQPWRAASVRQVGICLVSLLLPSATFASFSLSPAIRASRPYLTVIVTTPLRFEEAPAAPPVRFEQPAAGGPLPRTALPTSAALSGSKNATKESNEEGTSGSPGSEPATVAPSSPPKDKFEKPSATPPAVLPDDTRPKVHPEDFLPFFQFPGSHSNQDDVIPAPAEPGKLPPSSASYRQQ